MQSVPTPVLFFWIIIHRWVVTSATELANQVQRLLVGEEWKPLSSRQKVAGSVVELQRLISVSMHLTFVFDD